MVEAMGGAESEHYRQFCVHACEAYNILRKSASLILSLFHLMAGAAIPDIRSDPEKAMLKLQARTAKLPLPARKLPMPDVIQLDFAPRCNTMLAAAPVRRS